MTFDFHMVYDYLILILKFSILFSYFHIWSGHPLWWLFSNVLQCMFIWNNILLTIWQWLHFYYSLSRHKSFPWCLSGKESTCNTGNTSLIPGSGRFPWEENGYALQYSCLGILMDRRAWWATVHMAKSQTQVNA